jgi:peptidoglycan/xylan/chitin deacetylase (PgdA/CDA1 family)
VRFVGLVGGIATAGVGSGLLGAAGVLPGGLATSAALAALAGLVGAVTVASARPDLEVFGPCVRRGTHPGRLALTIDDGPHPVSTPALLAALAAEGARATFFVLADRVERHPELLRAMVAGGHEIGLHGMSHHPWYTTWSPAKGAAELRAAAKVLEAHGAPPVRWFRPPFGAVSPRVYAAAAEAGLAVAWCSVRTGDGGRIAPATLLARCARAVGTDIVLVHDGTETWRHLPDALRDWDARGIRVSTLSEALES